MKQIRSHLYILNAFAFLTLFSCSRTKFAELNSNPDAVLSIKPELELTSGQTQMYNNSFEAFYDFYEYIRPWTQLWVGAGGNSGSTGLFNSVANGDVRYNNFYNNVGPPLADVQHLISVMPAAEKATYVYLYAITGINMAEYAFYTSDPNGAMPYSQAFQARYTGNLTPVWDTQEAFFDTLDSQLKSYVATLETPQPVAQDTAGTNDLVFQGSTVKWIKAANSLRLRIAMRLLKQNPSQLTTVANEVLSDPIGLIDNTSDEWVFTGGVNFEGSGNSNQNWNPLGQGNECLEKHVVDFLVSTQDPRIRAILQPAAINSQAMFDSAQAQGQIPPSVTWNGQLYQGQYASPDSANAPNNSFYLNNLKFSFNGVAQSVNFPSIIQPYILYAGYNSGSGFNVFPVITYADVCFMRAELVIRGLSNDPMTAQQLYTNGITASLQDYDAWAQLAQTPNYTPLAAGEITNYLSQPGIAFQASTSLEQVLVQEYLNLYNNCNEAWALIKRTGYPSSSGVIMPLENITLGGNPVLMPRRYEPVYPLQGDLNYNNAVNAINAELSLPGYGAANDITGKVWWDE